MINNPNRYLFDIPKLGFNPNGNSWAIIWKNNPVGEMPRLNMSEREEAAEKLFDLLFKHESGNNL